MSRMLDWKKSVWAVGLLVAALFVGAQAAKADPIGGTDNLNCPEESCQGSTYWLLNLGTVVSDTTDILYRIDTSTYVSDGPQGTFIDAAAIKVLTHMTGTTLVDAPGGVGNWSLILGGLNDSGCDGTSGDAFACADDLAVMSTSSSVGHAPVGGILDWVFRVPGTGPFLDPSHIKARYIYWKTNPHKPGSWEKAGSLVSEDITLQECLDCPPPPCQEDCTPIPEPTSLLLLGTGLLGLGKLGHKYRNRKRPS